MYPSTFLTRLAGKKGKTRRERMKNRSLARTQIQNLYTLCREFHLQPSKVIQETHIDDYSFDLFVIREGRQKEK